MALDGIVISNIVAELNSTILNSKISKIAEPEADELLLTLKGPNGCVRHRKHDLQFLQPLGCW
jgi:predicted ribosome quality control (RQC) complex YloA/Tae2 family protein